MMNRDALNDPKPAVGATLASQYGSRFPKLLRLDRTNHEENLPSFWAEFFKAKKSDRSQVLMVQVHAAWELNHLRASGRLFIMPLLAQDLMPELAQDLQELRFVDIDSMCFDNCLMLL